MADASYRLTTHHVARSANHNAVAGAAYQTGTRLRDERTGALYDYSKRGEEIEARAPLIIIPAAEQSTQSAHLSRERLWSLAELAEKRKDANPARVIVVSFAFGLGPEQRSGMMREFAQWIADRYGVAVDYGIHRPDEDGDNRNFHGHMQITTRTIRNGRLTDKSQLEWEGTKLSKERKRLTEAGNLDAAKLCSGRAMLYELREKFEEIENRWIKEFNRQQETARNDRVSPINEVTCKSRRRRRATALKEALEELNKAAEARSQGQENVAIAHDHASLMARIVAAELNQLKQPHMGKAAGIERKHARMRAALAYEGPDSKLLRRKNRGLAELERRGISELPEFATELGEQRARVIRLNERRAGRLVRLRNFVVLAQREQTLQGGMVSREMESGAVQRDPVWDRIEMRIADMPLALLRMEPEYIADRARMKPTTAQQLWDQTPEGLQLRDLQLRMKAHVERMNLLAKQIDSESAGLLSGRNRTVRTMRVEYNRMDGSFRRMKVDEEKLVQRGRELWYSFERQTADHNAKIAQAREELPYLGRLQDVMKSRRLQQKLNSQQIRQRERGENVRQESRKPQEQGR